MDTLADGERVMALQIEQVTVVAKMRSIPERNGRVVLDFIVTLPKQLLGKSRSVVITPILHKPDESVALEDLVIRGGRFSLLQERDYWQYETYVERFRPDTVGREAAFNRFVKFPYPEDVRLDSLVEGRSTVTYYYSQAVKTDETSKKMLVTLQGQVLAVDDSAYRLPPSDTLSYVVSSMLSFVDTVPRYRIKVIDKFVTVEDRNYIQFFVGDTRVVDTLGDNRQQLDKITGLIRQIVEQQEFWVDTITLTAASSPEGAYAFNDRLSQGRAQALKRYLVRRYGRSIDTMLIVRWVAENWPELTQRIRTDKSIENREAILALIASEKNPDRREQAIRLRFPKEYAYIRSVIYPQLRAVNFRYNLRRVYSRTQRARRAGFHRDAAQAVVGQEPQRRNHADIAQARRIRGARRSGDPRRTLLAAARARLLAVRNLCRTLPPRYRGARGGLQPLREVSLSRRRPARLAGRRQEHRHVLLFPSSENRRDLEEDARNASGAGVGRGRQRLPSAAVRYAELRRILDAILCRYRTEVSHQGHRQVRDRRRPQLHSVLRGRYPCGRYAGRQPAAVGQDLWPDAADRRTAGVLCRYHHADGGIVSGGSLYLQRPALARKGRGAQTLPCPPIRQKHRYDTHRAVGS
ncbi:OmpA family protein [Alistipes onderdonkii]|nr:OmpA family protein [Alistipes onderdonkii]